MSKVLLMTSPSHDVPTSYLDAWMDKIITATKHKSDIEIVKLDGINANKENLTKLVEKHDPSLLLLNGHGTYESVLGFKDGVLIQCHDNEKLTIDKTLHVLSCKSGRTLGPRCIEIGAKTFIGYREDFKLAHLNRTSNAERLEDEIASTILEPAFEVVLAILKGVTIQDAFNKSRDLYKEKLGLLLTSTNDNLRQVGALLYHNFQHQICLGQVNYSF